MGCPDETDLEEAMLVSAMLPLACHILPKFLQWKFWLMFKDVAERGEGLRETGQFFLVIFTSVWILRAASNCFLLVRSLEHMHEMSRHALRWIWSTGLLPKDCQSYYAEIQTLRTNDFPALVPARLNTLGCLAASCLSKCKQCLCPSTPYPSGLKNICFKIRGFLVPWQWSNLKYGTM